MPPSSILPEVFGQGPGSVPTAIRGQAHADGLADAERDFAAVGVTHYFALSDGVIAGGGSLGIADGITQLTGAAPGPAYRRRGIQTSLFRPWRRLAATAAAGVVAVGAGVDGLAVGDEVLGCTPSAGA